MVLEQDPTYYTASVVMAAVFFFTVFYGRTFGDAVFDSVKNNYENEVLVEQLLNEKRLAEEARRDAENATRSKTQFFAAASHDLRQPLQAIGIYVSLLKKRAQGPLEPLVNNLSTAVESLSKLVEELLEISRLDSGAIQPRFEQIMATSLCLSPMCECIKSIRAAERVRTLQCTRHEYSPAGANRLPEGAKTAPAAQVRTASAQ